MPETTKVLKRQFIPFQESSFVKIAGSWWYYQINFQYNNRFFFSKGHPCEQKWNVPFPDFLLLTFEWSSFKTDRLLWWACDRFCNFTWRVLPASPWIQSFPSHNLFAIFFFFDFSNCFRNFAQKTSQPEFMFMISTVKPYALFTPWSYSKVHQIQICTKKSQIKADLNKTSPHWSLCTANLVCKSEI